jgi:hypothetical protein
MVLTILLQFLNFVLQARLFGFQLLHFQSQRQPRGYILVRLRLWDETNVYIVHRLQIHRIFSAIFCATSIDSMNSIKRCSYLLTLALDNTHLDIMHMCWPHILAIPMSMFSPTSVVLLGSFFVSSFINVSKSCDNTWYKHVHNVCTSILPREFDIFSHT